MRKTHIIAVLLGSAIVAASCTSSSSQNTATEVTLIAYDSFTPEEGIFDAFTQQTGATVKVVTAGDTGTMVSKAILTTGNPEGDVMWGIDNTFLSRAQKADVLLSYEPADEGDICVNYDKDWFSDRGLAVPTSFDDLVRPEYSGLLTVQDPVNSSPGLGFLLGTIAHFGDNNWEQYWRGLKDNKVNVAPDWTSAYYEAFSGSSGSGQYPLVVSYGSSPPAEVVFAETPITEPTTGVIEATCFRQTEYVGVMRGTKNTELAEKLVEFLLGKEFQESMPLTLFVFPVNTQAVLPEVFQKFAVRPANPLTVEPKNIEDNREAWLDTWRGLFS
jgi:thiamine transport system substrate-binding protein